MNPDRPDQFERLTSLSANRALTAVEFAAGRANFLGVATSNSNVAPIRPLGRRSIIVAFRVAAVTCVASGILAFNDFAAARATAPVVRIKAPAPQSVRASATTSPFVPKRVECVGRACRTLTAKGWAGIEAGMKVRRAESASGLDIISDGHYEDAEGTCRRYVIAGGPDTVSMLVEDEVVTSLSAWGKGFATERGIETGDSEAKVRKAYKILRQEPDIYGPPEDKMLFFNTQDGKFGIVFAISSGTVSRITVGGSSRGYAEGCM